MPSRRASPSPRRPSRWRWPRRWRANIPTCTCRRIVARTIAEIEFAQRALSEPAATILGIYERYHLLGPKTLLGHCIHLTHRECEVLAETRLGRGVLPDLEPVHRLGPVRPRPAGTSTACGSRSPPMSAAAPAIRCCARWTRATRCCSCAAQRLNPLALVLHDDAAAMPGRCRSTDTIGTLDAGHAMPTSWCSMRARRRQMALRMETVDTLAKNCSCCRPAATTARWPRSMCWARR